MSSESGGERAVFLLSGVRRGTPMPAPRPAPRRTLEGVLIRIANVALQALYRSHFIANRAGKAAIR